MSQKPWSVASLAGPQFGLIIGLTCGTGILTVIYIAVAVADEARVANIVVATIWGLITVSHAVSLVRALRYRRRNRDRGNPA
ncbi:hypothetical protein [Microbacterium thalli]|uniref:Uncharacterized protein n=1 Tax=Microbacterium thalli TaxID=3027921 RepID=A0ABT5SG91_9MICO|nr:hypothetical protein [Microbacterium thalli]MDD7961112.1 hypothetical protein [Microbacterium thalli]